MDQKLRLNNQKISQIETKSKTMHIGNNNRNVDFSKLNLDNWYACNEDNSPDPIFDDFDKVNFFIIAYIIRMFTMIV